MTVLSITGYVFSHCSTYVRVYHSLKIRLVQRPVVSWGQYKRGAEGTTRGDGYQQGQCEPLTWAIFLKESCMGAGAYTGARRKCTCDMRL
jgi:hypothetical protein